MPRLTIIAPACNEAEVLPAFHTRLSAALDISDLACQILYIDDGSSDATWATITQLAQADARVCALRLSRNFGKEAALTAGLDHVPATADAAIVIDSDLQDPPELIGQLIGAWQEGYDVVYATRSERAGESTLKRFTAAAFYRLLASVSDTRIPQDTGDYRLLSRRALDALRQLPERQRFMKGLFAWFGFKQTGIRYQREARASGRSKWNYWRLCNLAIEGITSFSVAPLRLATLAGGLTSAAAFAFGCWILLKAL
ncbi:MAG: glycosyltransferase family 2 protein, partial [Xanthomonadales bacterium]|nr:glycosyltransferase family 2 protein [Xanthomonadales bacterium]